MAYDMTAARRDPIARLDAWVIEELEALGRTKARPVERPKRRRDLEADVPEAAANDDPLPMDENQFIQRVTEWLSGRPNADLILEEIWRNVVAPAADEAFDDLEDGDAGDGARTELAAQAEDAEGREPPSAGLEAEAPEGPTARAADDQA